MKIKALKGVYPIIFITIIVLISVSLLTWTESITKNDSQMLGVLEEMFPTMSEYTFENDIYIIYADGAEIGYAFFTVGKGYKGDIDILVGLEDKTTIKGIIIILQEETPGLGARIAEISFADKFTGLNIVDAVLSQDGGQIDAITGATISSRAVTEAVRTAAIEKVESLKEQQ